MDANARRGKRISHGFARLRRMASEQAYQIAELMGAAKHYTSQLEHLMAGNAELTAKIAELDQFVTDDEAQDDANDAALQAVIVDLKAQLAAAGPVDTQPLIDQLEAIRQKLHTPAPSA